MLLHIRNKQPEACEKLRFFVMATNRIRSIGSGEIPPDSRSLRQFIGLPSRISLKRSDIGSRVSSASRRQIVLIWIKPTFAGLLQEMPPFRGRGIRIGESGRTSEAMMRPIGKDA